MTTPTLAIQTPGEVWNHFIDAMLSVGPFAGGFLLATAIAACTVLLLVGRDWVTRVNARIAQVQRDGWVLAELDRRVKAIEEGNKSEAAACSD